MSFVLQGFERCIHDKLPEKGKTINGEYYAFELMQLKEAIKLKCRRKLWVSVPLIQENMHMYTDQVSVAEEAVALNSYPILLTHQT